MPLKFILLAFIFSISLSPIYGQQKSDPKEDQKKMQEVAQLFAWGLNSQISSTLKELISKQDKNYIPIVEALYNDNPGPYDALIFEYFNVVEYFDYVEEAADELRYYDNQSDEAVFNILDYLVNAKNRGHRVKDLNQIVWDLSEVGNDMLTDKAYRTLGKLEAKEYLSTLKEIYEDPYSDDRHKPQILKTIGAISGKEGLSWFVALLDEELPKTHKWAVLEVMASSGDDKIFNTILNYYNSSEPYLRLKIMESVGDFSVQNIEKLVKVGLKDDFWRVRKEAINLVPKHKFTKLVSQLIFKVKTDPENVIKLDAINALSQIQTKEAGEFLLDSITENKFSLSLQKAMSKSLFSYPVSSYGKKLFDWVKEQDKKDNNIVGYIATLVSENASNELGSFINYFISHKSAPIQHAAILAMTKIEKIYNPQRVEFLYQNNKKNYLGAAIKTLYEKCNIEVAQKEAKGKTATAPRENPTSDSGKKSSQPSNEVKPIKAADDIDDLEAWGKP